MPRSHGEKILSHNALGRRRRWMAGGDDDARRHPGLHIYATGYFIGVLGFCTIPFCTFASHQTCDLLLVSTARKRFPFLQRLARRWGYVLFAVSLWEAAACRASAFCPSRYPVQHGFTQAWLERPKSFVSRLLRTAVQYVIYPGVAGVTPNGTTVAQNCSVLPHLFCDISCDSSSESCGPLPLGRVATISDLCRRLFCFDGSSRDLNVWAGGWASGKDASMPSVWPIPAPATTPASCVSPASCKPPSHRHRLEYTVVLASPPDACLPLALPSIPSHTTPDG